MKTALAILIIALIALIIALIALKLALIALIIALFGVYTYTATSLAVSMIYDDGSKSS